MKTKNTKITEKVTKAKAKISEKAAKVSKKAAKACALLALILAIGGCATSEPASRSTSARYGDIIVLAACGITQASSLVKLFIGED